MNYKGAADHEQQQFFNGRYWKTHKGAQARTNQGERVISK